MQVLKPEQFALICIHAYPYIISGEQWMCVWKSDFSHESKAMIVAAAAVFDMKAEWDNLEALLADTTSKGSVTMRLSQETQATSSKSNIAGIAGTADTAAVVAAASSSPIATALGASPSLASQTALAASSSLYAANEMDSHHATFGMSNSPFAAVPNRAVPHIMRQTGSSSRQNSWAAGILDPLLAVSNPLDTVQTSWSPALSDPSLLRSRSSLQDFGRWPAAGFDVAPQVSMFGAAQYPWAGDPNQAAGLPQSAAGQPNQAAGCPQQPWVGHPHQAVGQPQHSWVQETHQAAATASNAMYSSSKSGDANQNFLQDLSGSGLYSTPQPNWGSLAGPQSAGTPLDNMLGTSLAGVHQSTWAQPSSALSSATDLTGESWLNVSQSATTSTGYELLQASPEPAHGSILEAKARLQNQTTPTIASMHVRPSLSLHEASDAPLTGSSRNVTNTLQSDTKPTLKHNVSLY